MFVRVLAGAIAKGSHQITLSHNHHRVGKTFAAFCMLVNYTQKSRAFLALFPMQHLASIVSSTPFVRPTRPLVRPRVGFRILDISVSGLLPKFRFGF